MAEGFHVFGTGPFSPSGRSGTPPFEIPDTIQGTFEASFDYASRSSETFGTFSTDNSAGENYMHDFDLEFGGNTLPVNPSVASFQQNKREDGEIKAALRARVLSDSDSEASDVENESPYYSFPADQHIQHHHDVVEEIEGNMSDIGNNPDDNTGLDDRLVNPKAYFAKLDTVRDQILAESTIRFYDEEAQADNTLQSVYNRHISAPFPKRTSLSICTESATKRKFQMVNFDAEIYFTNKNSNEPRTQAQDISFVERLDHFFHLIECRNTILSVMSNIEAMRVVAYCQENISIVIIDPNRSNVARLVPIDIKDVKALAIAFEATLYSLLQLDILHTSATAFASNFDRIATKCESIESSLGLGTENISALDRWRFTVQILDLAVASYATAHVGNSLSPSRYGFTLPGRRFGSQHQLFRFYQRDFKCLGKFFNGHRVWVLEKTALGTAYASLRGREDETLFEPLYLSTKAEVFADIWGPMWGSCESRDSTEISHYSVGNGIILPRRDFTAEHDLSVHVNENEVLCHWMSQEERNSDQDFDGAEMGILSFDAVMLIGAGTRFTARDCNFNFVLRKRQLKNADRLNIRGTMKKSRQIESETYQFQVGWSGVTAGAQRSYKLRERLWKQALVEAWRNEPEGRNPRVLEHWLGVEVSACSLNARRQRLVTVLGSQTMQNFLHGCSINWADKECHEAFFSAINAEDHTTFRKLYLAHPDWQTSWGCAVSLCLDALSETGFREEGFNVLWAPARGDSDWIATLRRSEHTWVGFLKDTRDCCTLAILENICLEIDDLSCVRRCQREALRDAVAQPTSTTKTFTALKTAVIFNESELPKTMCKVKNKAVTKNTPWPVYSRWSASSVEEDQQFHFGQNGRLTSLGTLKRNELLMTWEGPNIFRKLISKGNQHQEHIRDEEWETLPLNVIIISTGQPALNFDRLLRDHVAARQEQAPVIDRSLTQWQLPEVYQSENVSPKVSSLRSPRSSKEVIGGVSHQMERFLRTDNSIPRHLKPDTA